jgi:hypothetical protein
VRCVNSRTSLLAGREEHTIAGLFGISRLPGKSGSVRQPVIIRRSENRLNS